MAYVRRLVALGLIVVMLSACATGGGGGGGSGFRSSGPSMGRKGWGVVLMMLGVASVGGGVAIAVSPGDEENPPSGMERAGLGLAYGGLGVGLFMLGRLLAFPKRQDPPTQASATQ